MPDAKPKRIYEETYRKPGLKIKDFCLPKLPSATGFSVVEAYILRAGSELLNGRRREYQDVRIYLQEADDSNADKAR